MSPVEVKEVCSFYRMTCFSYLCCCAHNIDTSPLLWHDHYHCLACSFPSTSPPLIGLNSGFISIWKLVLPNLEPVIHVLNLCSVCYHVLSDCAHRAPSFSYLSLSSHVRTHCCCRSLQYSGCLSTYVYILLITGFKSCPEDGGSRALQNVGNHVWNLMLPYLKDPQS
jgi:hypothetical protein